MVIVNMLTFIEINIGYKLDILYYYRASTKESNIQI